MEITGEIREIIYKNEINSYTIAEFETDEEITTVVGYLPFINTGDTLKLIGKFVEHKDYGTQFKIDTFEKMMPQSLDALERYLANGNIKGIGEVDKRLAKRVINGERFAPATRSLWFYNPFGEECRTTWYGQYNVGYYKSHCFYEPDRNENCY